MDIEKITKAIEMDAGERLPDIRESLQVSHHAMS